jgi:hypothetical protein
MQLVGRMPGAIERFGVGDDGWLNSSFFWVGRGEKE